MKNKMMRLASLLMVAVLLTTSVVSGTYAKYTTEHEATTSARVARWGFNGTTFTLDDLFAATYDGGQVLSSDLSKVIAPGTTGSQVIAFATESGQAPEVAYSFTVEASSTSDKATNSILQNANIKWAFYPLGMSPSEIDAQWGDFDALLAEINGMDETLKPGELPKLAGSYVVAWKWVFHTSDTHDVDVDTPMGNENPLETVNLTIKINATQLD